MRPLNRNAGCSRNADKFVVRLQDGMRARISAIAAKQHRSMNSEIVSRLETSLQADSVDDDIRVHTNTLSIGEAKMLKAFREMTGKQQSALIEFISSKSPLKKTEQEKSSSQVAA